MQTEGPGHAIYRLGNTVADAIPLSRSASSFNLPRGLHRGSDLRRGLKAARMNFRPRPPFFSQPGARIKFARYHHRRVRGKKIRDANKRAIFYRDVTRWEKYLWKAISPGGALQRRRTLFRWRKHVHINTSREVNQYHSYYNFFYLIIILLHIFYSRVLQIYSSRVVSRGNTLYLRLFSLRFVFFIAQEG